MESQIQKPNNLAIPVAIIVAGVIIGVSLIFALRTPSGGSAAALTPPGPSGDLEALAPISGDDHIRGSLDAPVKVVEYSDTECPFCKRFHSTLQQAIDEYGKSGKVAWVYRHFPLDQLHSKARKEAEATECANELGGNDKFWAYLDRLMEITPANNGLDPAELPKIAQYVGINVTSFNECLSSGRYAQKIEEHVQNAAATGGNGTPWSIVVTKSGKKYPLSGAQPYESVKQIIELALQDQ